MPNRDGTGPAGQGRGRGGGRGQGRGSGMNRSGGGRGRNKGGAYGPGGDCICAKCKTKVPHQRGQKCAEIKCPNCGHPMIREELLNSKK